MLINQVNKITNVLKERLVVIVQNLSLFNRSNLASIWFMFFLCLYLTFVPNADTKFEMDDFLGIETSP